jgi:hypothetical protein
MENSKGKTIEGIIQIKHVVFLTVSNHKSKIIKPCMTGSTWLDLLLLLQKNNRFRITDCLVRALMET